MLNWMNQIIGGVKIAGRNINNLRYADDTTRMAESEEELKSPLMKVKSQQTVENSSKDGNPRDGNSRPPDLPPDKSVCRSRSNSWNWTWNN